MDRHIIAFVSVLSMFSNVLFLVSFGKSCLNRIILHTKMMIVLTEQREVARTCALNAYVYSMNKMYAMILA